MGIFGNGIFAGAAEQPALAKPSGQIAIDKGVPMPEAKNGSGRPPGEAKYPWRTMEVGDSFLFPAGTKRSTAHAAANVAGRRTGRKFSLRTTPEGFRCWRKA